jgi:hypothetical protein
MACDHGIMPGPARCACFDRLGGHGDMVNLPPPNGLIGYWKFDDGSGTQRAIAESNTAQLTSLQYCGR